MSKNLLEKIDLVRTNANQGIRSEIRSAFGQYMTPIGIAEFMCSLFQNIPKKIKLLDPGAGVGSLTAAFVNHFCAHNTKAREVKVTAFEIDAHLASCLSTTLWDCAVVSQIHKVSFDGKLRKEDFILETSKQINSGLSKNDLFTHVIMNPPYKKISNISAHRLSLRKVGIETSNLYTAFLALSVLLLEENGELVAITPRSFCNGPYFLPFRRLFLEHMALKHIHVFEERNKAFKDNEVLQENIIFHAIKNGKKDRVKVSSSSGADFYHYTCRDVDYSQVICPNDPEHFIHLAVREGDDETTKRIKAFSCRLEDLDISVSTGPVVDFRLKDSIKQNPVSGSVPLIYSTHCKNNFVVWPIAGRKPNAIIDDKKSNKWLMPNGFYTLVKRFSSKEEKKRVVASVHDPGKVKASSIGFENHLNVFHENKAGLPEDLAKGLTVFLNSSLVDSYFRQFNGHTQVNATDLRKLTYPNRKQLISLGKNVNGKFPSQETIDLMIKKLEVERLGEQQKQKNKRSLGGTETSRTSTRAV